MESGTAATPGTVLENFWPSMVDHNLYRVALETCRYDRDLDIWVYPNMEVEIAFMLTIGMGYSGNLKYKRSQLNGYHKGYGFKYIKSSLSAEATETGHLGWDVQGKSKINGTEYSLKLGPIKSTVETAKMAYNETVDYLALFDPDTASRDMDKSPAVSKGVLDIEFVIDPPNIAFALGWKFGTAGSGELVPIYTGGLKLDPLIGITIGVDLVPLVKTFGGVGNAVDWMIKGIEYLFEIDVYILFKVFSAVKGETSLSYNEIDGFDEEGKQKLELEAGVTLMAGAKSNDVVYVTSTTRAGGKQEREIPKWKLEGKVQTSFLFTEEVGYDQSKNGEQYRESKVTWKGAKMTITRYELISRKMTDHEEPKYNLEGTNEFPLFDEQDLHTSREYLTENKKKTS